MARDMRGWLAAALLGCGAIVLAYVPPGGVSELRRRRDRAHEPTAARVEEQRLARQWRSLDLELRLEQYRRRLEPELARRRVADAAGPVLLTDGLDTVPQGTRQLLAAAFDTVWRRLGLGVTKVAVVVVVATPRGASGVWAGAAPAYLLPAPSDRTVCIALVPVHDVARLRRLLELKPDEWTAFGDREAWLKSAIGPCAFYAAFGVPGKPVQSWLGERRFDLALYPDWDRSPAAAPPAVWWAGVVSTSRDWPSLYRHFTPRAIACLAGRTAACRAAVLEGADTETGDSLPRVIATEEWWRHAHRLWGSDRYLADVAHDVGRDRFLRFWTSPLPVDTALTAALQQPVAEWTERWERRLAPRLRLGATAPLRASFLGLLVAGAALTSAALGVRRRQVR